MLTCSDSAYKQHLGFMAEQVMHVMVSRALHADK